MAKRPYKVHDITVWKMFLRTSLKSPIEIIEGLANIREVLSKWQSRILKPEYIFIAPVEEGDVGMWNNWVSP
jgi:hypothetical protein